MAKRNPYSRWRRLPPVFRSGEHKLPDPGEEPQRIILYLPAAVLDQAESLAGKAGVPTVQEYCARLLGQAIEVERVKAHMVDVEAKRGPLEGFKEVTGDPDYLAEWQKQFESRESTAGKPQLPDPSPGEPGSEVMILGDDNEKLNEDRNQDLSLASEHGELPERVIVRIEPAPWVTGPVITERIVPEVLDGKVIEASPDPRGGGRS